MHIVTIYHFDDDYSHLGSRLWHIKQALFAHRRKNGFSNSSLSARFKMLLYIFMPCASKHIHFLYGCIKNLNMIQIVLSSYCINGAPRRCSCFLLFFITTPPPSFILFYLVFTHFLI